MMKIIIALLPFSATALRWKVREETKDAQIFDDGDAEEARLDELAIEGFQPSKRLEAGWISANQKLNGVGFSREKDSAVPLQCVEEVKKKLFKNRACADTWFESRDCTKPFEIPAYRLGDEFYEYLSTKNTGQYAQFYFPGSIGDLYWSKHHQRKDLKTMNQIVDDPRF